MSRILFPLPLMAAILAYGAGCTPDLTTDQLHTQLRLIRQQVSVVTPPPVAIRDFTMVSYDHDGGATPFGESADAESQADLRPPQRGPQQYLETLPLEALRLVGILRKTGQAEVLILANGIVHRCRPGDYLGQQFGMIRRISDNGVELEELVPAGKQHWESRIAVLTLEENG